MPFVLLLLLNLAADDPAPLRFFNSIDGMSRVTQGDNGSEIHTYTRIDYLIVRRRDTVGLRFLRQEVNAESDGELLMKSVSTPTSFETAKRGQEPKKYSIDDARPERQAFLKTLFGGQACELKVDANGAELSRALAAASPAEKYMVRTLVDNTLFFHPPYVEGKETWTAERVLSQDQQTQMRGMLRYERRPRLKGLSADHHIVAVSGALKPATIPDAPPGTEPSIDGVSQARGTQIFDAKRRAWVWGEVQLEIDIWFRAERDARVRGLLIVRQGEPLFTPLDIPATIESTNPAGAFQTTSGAWLLQGRQSNGVYRFRAATIPGTMWATFHSVDSEAAFKAKVAESAKRSAPDFEAAEAPVKDVNDSPRPGFHRWKKQGVIRRKDVPAFYLTQTIIWNPKTKTALELVAEASMPLSKSFSEKRTKDLNDSMESMSNSFQ